MTFQTTALPAAEFSHMFALSDTELKTLAAVRVFAQADTGYPCRVSLDDAKQGCFAARAFPVDH